MRYLQFLPTFFLGVALATAANSSPDQLAKIKTIYVAPLEGQNQAITSMLREKLISTLTKIQGISIVDDEESADAVLTGTGVMEATTSEYGHPRFFIQGGVHLTSKNGGVIVWAANIASSRYARSASSSFAENVAKSLGRAFTDTQQKKGS